MGFPLKFNMQYANWNARRHFHFEGNLTGYKYYYKGNGQGGHGGSNTMIGNNIQGYEHVLSNPHFGLSGGGGGGGSVFLHDGVVVWRGYYNTSASGLSYPTADGTSGQAITTDGSGNLSLTTIQASELTTQGAVFSNYNTVSSNATSTTSSSKNSFLFGPITVASGVTWTIAGNGTLRIFT